MSFVQYIRLPSDTTLTAFDTAQLHRLRNQVNGQSDPAHGDKVDAVQKGEAEVARQFEAIFIQQMLKQARQGSSLSGLFDTEHMRLTQSMADEQMAIQMSDPGIGLAQTLLAQMRGGQGEGLAKPVLAGLPESASSRLPQLQSRMKVEGKEVASSISDLIDMLSETRIGKATASVVSAIRGAPGHIEKFLDQMGPAAHVAANQSGVPAELILSQAALESGWGRREIKGEDGSPSYNLFGIKATGGWKGKVVNVLTTEYEDGVARKMVQPFRAYGSYVEAFADYARLISQNDRYSEVLTAPSAEVAARRIQKAGYATDPAYAEKLISIMSYFKSASV